MISTIEITPDPHEIGTTEHDPGIEPSIYRSNIPHIDIKLYYLIQKERGLAKL